MPFSDVVGHKPIVTWLTRQIAAEAICRSYLLLGPEGVGKRFLAQQLAQAIQCGAERHGEACGQCPMCRLVADGHHPDVTVMQVPESRRQITIEQIRTLQHWLSLKAFHGGRKVAIIDRADSMQEPAASALLKTLEEPPPTSVLVLVAAHESRLLPTIVSRCAKLYCSPLSTEDLVRALGQQGVATVASYLARRVARLVSGRLGRAIELASPEGWERYEAVRQELLSAMESGNLEPETPYSRQESEVIRRRLEEGLEAVAAWYRDAMLIQVGAARDLLARPDQYDALKALAVSQPAERLSETVDRLYETLGFIQQRVNPKSAIASLVAGASRRS